MRKQLAHGRVRGVHDVDDDDGRLLVPCPYTPYHFRWRPLEGGKPTNLRTLNAHTITTTLRDDDDNGDHRVINSTRSHPFPDTSFFPSDKNKALEYLSTNNPTSSIYNRQKIPPFPLQCSPLKRPSVKRPSRLIGQFFKFPIY